MSRITMTEIEEYLAMHHGARSMDNENDRRVVAFSLAGMINILIEKETCQDCAHLEEVHQYDNNEDGGSCLGGPETHCDCQGFNGERHEDDDDS